MRFLLILVLLGAFAASDRGRRNRFQHMWPEGRACSELLKTVTNCSGTVINACVDAQPGLRDIIAKLKVKWRVNRTAMFVKPYNPNRHHGCRFSDFAISLLEESNYTAQAQELRVCIAGAQGFVKTGAEGKKEFDVEALKNKIATTVANFPQKDNTTLGLNQCSVNDLKNFDMGPYMSCVKIFCATGKPPVIAAP